VEEVVPERVGYNRNRGKEDGWERELNGHSPGGWRAPKFVTRGKRNGGK